MFSSASVKSTGIEFLVETRDREHTNALIAALEQNGIKVEK
jgi:hypothetical protein